MNRWFFLFSSRFLFIITGMIFISTVYGQNTRYLFIQTENNQPFYLRLMGATLSSNATGYLLVPKLTDGDYDLYVGFAQTEQEQQFTVKLAGKDLGFSLKQELDNTWSLFNLVDFSLVRGQLAMNKPREEKKNPLIIEQPLLLKDQEPDNADKKEVKKAPNAVKKYPEIKKIYERISEDGIDMVFVVSGSAKNDTVILYVPALKPKGEAQNSAGSKDQTEKKRFRLTGIQENQLLFTRPKLC